MANPRAKLPGADAIFGPPSTGRPPLNIRETTGDSPQTPTPASDPLASGDWERFERPRKAAQPRTTTTEGVRTRPGPLGPVQANWAKFTMRIPPHLRVSLAGPKAVIAERTGRRTLSDQDLILALLDLVVIDGDVTSRVIDRLDGDPS